MLIYCLGMPRSGSTLQFQIAAELVERHGLGRRLPFLARPKVPRLVRALCGRSRAFVLKTHALDPVSVDHWERDSSLGLYSYRDVRDALVSALRMAQQPYTDSWARAFLQSVFEHQEAVLRMPRVLVQRYEDITGDLGEAVAQVASHLGIAMAPGEADALALNFVPEAQKARLVRANRHMGYSHRRAEAR